jgi:Ca2+-binding EF-hand superfamily protein
MLSRNGVTNTYSHKVRVGNWNEEREMKDLQMKEYLYKKQRGELLSSSVSDQLGGALAPVGLSFSRDGSLHNGDHVLLFSSMTEGVLSVDINDRSDPTRDDGFAVTTSKMTQGNVARNTFVIEAVKKNANKGDVLNYGDQFRLRINPRLKGQGFYLASQPKSYMSASKKARCQEVTFSSTRNFDTVWRVELKNHSRRVVATGSPAKANEEVIIVHCGTAAPLASDTKFRVPNDYGIEWEVHAHSYVSIFKKQEMQALHNGSTTVEQPVRSNQKQNHWAFLSASSEEMEALLNAKNEVKQESVEELMDKIKDQLAIRYEGTVGMTQLSRRFRVSDSDRSGSLSVEEFHNSLSQVGLRFSDNDFMMMLAAFDKNRDGEIGYSEFLTGLRGPVNARREALVNEAYTKFDKNGDGQVNIEDLRDVYSGKEHPDVIAGRKTEDEVLTEFLANFEGDIQDGIITREEFQEYYRGVGAYVDSDEYFEYMIRQAWTLEGSDKAMAQVYATRNAHQ